MSTESLSEDLTSALLEDKKSEHQKKQEMYRIDRQTRCIGILFALEVGVDSQEICSEYMHCSAGLFGAI